MKAPTLQRETLQKALPHSDMHSKEQALRSACAHLQGRASPAGEQNSGLLCITQFITIDRSVDCPCLRYGLALLRIETSFEDDWSSNNQRIAIY